MADPRDDRVSRAYRDMPGEGPPPALDAAIQAAARRTVGSRPRAARPWQVPLSIAALLVLAIGVSLQVEREKPLIVDGTPVPAGSAEYPVPQAQEAQDAAPPVAKQALPPEPERAAPATPVVTPAPAPRPAATPSAPAPEARRFAPDPSRAELPAPASLPVPESPPSRNASPAPPAIVPSAPARAPATIAAPPAAAGAAARDDSARPAPAAAPRAKSELAREATVQEKKMSEALDTPEHGLDRIAELRARGLHDEADRALAEFRRAHPGYRISEDWLRKIEKR